DMITKTPEGGFYVGKGGGILNAILGSLYLAGLSTFLATIIAIPICIYLNIYSKKGSRIRRFSKLIFDVLFGVPSIVYGAIAFSSMVWLRVSASLIGGVINIALLIIPIVVRTLDELIQTIPTDLELITRCLGTSSWRSARVTISYIKPGLYAANLLR